MDTLFPPVSMRRSSVSSRLRRLCLSKFGVRQTQTHFFQQQEPVWWRSMVLFDFWSLLFSSPSLQMWVWSQWKGKMLYMVIIGLISLLIFLFTYFSLKFCSSELSFTLLLFSSSSDEPLKWQFVDQYVSESGVRDSSFVSFKSFCHTRRVLNLQVFLRLTGEKKQRCRLGVHRREGDQREEGFPQSRGYKGYGHQHLQWSHPETRHLHQ